MKISRGAGITVFVTVLVVLDQVVKLLVKTNMSIGEHIDIIGDWFKLLFIENNGMAFGMQFGGKVGKFILTLGRIVLIGLIVWYIRKLMKEKNTPVGVFFGLAAILAGAIGNVIDCIFYGVIFDYAPLFFGKVVDMLYFPLIDTTLPLGFPFWGGRHVIFFRPIFNIADSCVTCGTFYLIIFKWRFFSYKLAEEESEKTE